MVKNIYSTFFQCSGKACCVISSFKSIMESSSNVIFIKTDEELRSYSFLYFFFECWLLPLLITRLKQTIIFTLIYSENGFETLKRKAELRSATKSDFYTLNPCIIQITDNFLFQHTQEMSTTFQTSTLFLSWREVMILPAKCEI